MSQFECPVVRVTIEPHPNADAIEIARIGGFQSIVKKGQFKTGDLAVYLPEAAVLPEWLLKQLGFWNELNNVGTLNGSAKNRIKAVKLRGILSQGVLFPTRPYSETEVLVDSAPHEGNQGAGIVAIGGDASGCLGVTKYEPTIPAQMAGRAIGANMAITHNYDFENIKKNTSLFDEGEEVVMTEKIHGTLLQICLVPPSEADEKYYCGRVVITSKGLGGRGIILDHNDESNVYAEVCKKFDLLEKMLDLASLNAGVPIVLFGEVYGTGIQDLGYSSCLSFRAFDMCQGVRDQAKFAPYDRFRYIMDNMGIARVPELYRGPYSQEALLAHTDGSETISGKSGHIREGVVVKTTREDSEGNELRHPRWGRKIAKSVSAAYLLRKGEVTEFA